jgi:cytochrome c-type biogenesis protein CcmF
MVQGSDFKGTSRETLLLINNLMFTVIAAMVLIGTLYPLALDALEMGKISVGPPYFGLMFALLLVPIAFFLPAGFYSRWQGDSVKRLARELVVPGVFAVLTGIATAIWLPSAGGWGIAGSAAAAWIIVANIRYYVERMRDQSKPGRSETGMVIAHLGVGLFLIGASLTNAVSSEKHLRMAAGDRFELAGYEFVFEGTTGVTGPNFVADRGEFIAYKDGEVEARLYPEKRRYRSGQVMTEAALDPGLTRDLYVSLGEPLDNRGEAWAVRLYHKPFIRFIWLGGLLMMFGGFLAASDRRYRREVPARKEATA